MKPSGWKRCFGGTYINAMRPGLAQNSCCNASNASFGVYWCRVLLEIVCSIDLEFTNIGLSRRLLGLSLRTYLLPPITPIFLTGIPRTHDLLTTTTLLRLLLSAYLLSSTHSQEQLCLPRSQAAGTIEQQPQQQHPQLQ